MKRNFKSAYDVFAAIGVKLHDVGLTDFYYEYKVVFAKSKSAAKRKAAKLFWEICAEWNEESLKENGPYDWTMYTVEKVYVKHAGNNSIYAVFDNYCINQKINVWKFCEENSEWHKQRHGIVPKEEKNFICYFTGCTGEKHIEFLKARSRIHAAKRFKKEFRHYGTGALKVEISGRIDHDFKPFCCFI